MTVFKRAWLLALGILAALSFGATAASATLTVVVANAGAIRLQVNQVTLTMPSIGLPVTCNYILTGTINNGLYPIPLPGLIQIGQITGGMVNGCNLGTTATLLVSPQNPWPIAFTSNLVLSPKYTFTILGFQDLKESALLGLRCLYTGNINFNYFNQAGGQARILAGGNTKVSNGLSLDTCPRGLVLSFGQEIWQFTNNAGGLVRMTG